MTTPAAPLSVRALGSSLVAIAALAAAPFLVAGVVGERRLAAAGLAASDIAASLRSPATTLLSSVNLLVGSGNVPQFQDQPEWRGGTSAPLSAVLGVNAEVPADPWRNAYVVNIGSSGPVWALSAGPNGIVETPYAGAESPQGDDVAVTVRPSTPSLP